MGRTQRVSAVWVQGQEAAVGGVALTGRRGSRGPIYPHRASFSTPCREAVSDAVCRGRATGRAARTPQGGGLPTSSEQWTLEREPVRESRSTRT